MSNTPEPNQKFPHFVEEMSMTDLVLIGMPGCGKSTAGVLAAKALTMDFLDTDLLLQRRYQKPLQKLVDELGTAGFERAEEECLLSLSCEHTVIATGGSVALEERAMAHLKTLGRVVLLDVPYEVLKARLGDFATRGISMPKGQTLLDLYEYRRPFYHRAADVIVQTGACPIEETVAALVGVMRG